MSYEIKRVITKIANTMMTLILQRLEDVVIVNRKKFNEHKELI
ncbi:winged helix-turn-helix transcriptional regulator [Clostridioides sp. ES-S-0048-02]|nr:winged helix-turn-helix transcriptional regulator [Clostridioides sp. ES-S-0048-02]